jgi:hypothetical protein
MYRMLALTVRKLVCWYRINKSQGQTLKHIAVVLAQPVMSAEGTFLRSEPLPCFAHGQLVVALSRVGHPGNVHVYLHTTQMHDCRTESIVLPGALLAHQNGRMDVAPDDVLYDPVEEELADEHPDARVMGIQQWLRNELRTITNDVDGDAIDDENTANELAMRIDEGTLGAAQFAAEDLMLMRTVNVVAAAVDRQCPAGGPNGLDPVSGLRHWYAFDEPTPDDVELTPIDFDAPAIAMPVPNVWDDVEGDVPIEYLTEDERRVFGEGLPPDDDPDLLELMAAAGGVHEADADGTDDTLNEWYLDALTERNLREMEVEWAATGVGEYMAAGVQI